MASYGTAVPGNRQRPADQLDIPQNEPEFPVARSVDHLLINNRSLSNIPRIDSCNIILIIRVFTLLASTIRRPFVFNHRSRATSTNSINSDSNSTANVDVNRHHNMAIRYRLFNRLDPGGQTLVMNK